jgi:hypothetical protein
MSVKPIRKSAKRDKKVPKAGNPFVGRWIATDEWSTDVSLIITSRSGEMGVRAVDQSDGEEAEIFDVKLSKRELSFAAHWSSGQFTKYRLRQLRADEVEVVFTFTATQTFKRN